MKNVCETLREQAKNITVNKGRTKITSKCKSMLHL